MFGKHLKINKKLGEYSQLLISENGYKAVDKPFMDEQGLIEKAVKGGAKH